MASAPPGGGPVAALKREHKKAFENTATAAGTILLPEPPGPYTVTDTEEITVNVPLRQGQRQGSSRQEEELPQLPRRASRNRRPERSVRASRSASAVLG